MIGEYFGEHLTSEWLSKSAEGRFDMPRKFFFTIYCICIATVTLIPLTGMVANYYSIAAIGEPLFLEEELKGVTEMPQRPLFTVGGFLNGSYQADFEKYFTDRLFLRRSMTRVYNQILYTLFHATDNAGILVGKENYLFEKPYATAYLSELLPDQVLSLKENIDKLQELADLLKQRGTPLLIRMSPNKVEYYSEFLPSGYDRYVKMKTSGEYGLNWYQVFCEEIKKTDIMYYDLHDYFLQMKKEGKIVFCKGGTHWSLAPMGEYINGMNQAMEPLVNRELGRMIEQDSSVINGVMGLLDDQDIWDICWNALSVKPDYLSPHISFTTAPPTHTQQSAVSRIHSWPEFYHDSTTDHIWR